MKILVLSDSHSALSFMRQCIDAAHPDAVIHLGDYVRDGEAMAEEYPSICFYQVAGNCDLHRVAPDYPEIMLEHLGGVKIFFTHGHRHGVKIYPDKLILDARKAGADAVLYGHTHEADCRQLDDGMWILNPGTCGTYGGSAGMILIENQHVVCCKILRWQDLEEMR